MIPELARDLEYLQRISKIVYRTSSGPDQYSLAEIHSHFSTAEVVTVDSYIQRLSLSGLVEYSPFQQVLQRTLRGKRAADLDCVVEIVLGFPYVDAKYREAVFHVILDKNGIEETGGTAFSSSDFPGALVTARHVIENYSIKRIESHEGKVVECKVVDLLYARDEGLDLACIVVDQFQSTRGFRIAWDSTLSEQEMVFDQSAAPPEPSGRRGEAVAIFGFPPTPWHHPSLYCFNAEIESRSKSYSLRDSLILSKSRPGCSGGPVVDYRGMVVGIVSTSSNRGLTSQAEDVRREATNQYVDYIAAVPSGYLSEVRRH